MATAFCPQKCNLPAFLRHHARLDLLIDAVALNIYGSNNILPGDRAKRVLRGIVIPFLMRERVLGEAGRRWQIWLEECVEYGGGM